MQNELNKVRFSVKPLKSNDNKVVELARTVGIHPLAYQELPYDPEYSFYAGRLNPEVLSHATADEMYWNCLLYTSPSPRDLYRSRMPSSA